MRLSDDDFAINAVNAMVEFDHWGIASLLCPMVLRRSELGELTDTSKQTRFANLAID